MSLMWVAIPFSRGSSWPKDHAWVSCIAAGLFTVWATREVRSKKRYRWPVKTYRWHRKRWSTSLIIRKVEIKTTMRYHFTLVRMAIIKKSKNNKFWRGCREKGKLYSIGGNENWYNHYGSSMKVLKTLTIKLPYDYVIPLLGIYPEKTIIQKDTCTPMFTACLFTIAKTWRQPKCQQMNE